MIALQSFKKDDVLVNYHGKVVTNINSGQYGLQKGVLSEYVLEIAGPTRQLIDASNEYCPLHKCNECLDRLAKHASQKIDEANMKMVEVVFSCIGKKLVILKATRDLVPFEQLHFD